MPWRSKRGGKDKAEQALAAATLARVARDGPSGEAVDAVRGAIARAELERPLDTVVIVALGETALAEAVAAGLRPQRDLAVVDAEAVPAEVDGAVAVASAGMPANEIVAALAAVESVLLGVVLAEERVVAPTPSRDEPAPIAPQPAQPAAAGVDAGGDPALAALVELERAAGAPAAPAVPERVAPPVESRPVEAEQNVSSEDDLQRRVATLTHREAALRRIADSIEKYRTRVEERERAVEEREQALASGRAADAEHEQRLQQALERAEDAERRVHELEQRVAELEQRRPEPPAVEQPIPSAQPEPPEPAPAEPVPAPTLDLDPVLTPPVHHTGRHNLYRLEQLVRDAETQGDPRAEEWSVYLPLLREHAEADGSLPAQFDSLIESVFGSALPA